MRILLVTALLFATISPLLAQEREEFNILIVTGGHGFPMQEFLRIFDEMPNVRYDTAVLPRDMDLLSPGLEQKYDLLFTYDMNNFPTITSRQRYRFAALIELGMPFIVMHHSLCGYDGWDKYKEMIGGRYLMRDTVIDGVLFPASTYKYNLDIAVEIVDRNHPITRGINNFVIRDEGYGGLFVRDDVNVILRTDHPDASPELAWTTQYGKSAIFVIALGHDGVAYANPNLRRILHQAIQWCIEETRRNRQ